MAITFQRISASTGTSLTVDIGSAGNDRLVIVGVNHESAPGATYQGAVTVDGITADEIAVADNPDGAGNHQEMFAIDETALGSSSGTVTVSYSGGDGTWAIYAAVYYGVDSSTPSATAVDQTTVAPTSISVGPVNVPADALVATGFGNGGSGTMTFDAPLTSRDDNIGPPSSAVFGFADFINSSTPQTNQTYTGSATGNSLRNTGIVAVFLNNNPSPPGPTYSDAIVALNPDHLWVLDAVTGYVDQVGSLDAVATGTSATGDLICEDTVTNSVVSNDTADRVAVPTAATVDQALTRKAIGGWIRVTAVQPPPKSIYGEGTTNNQLRFVCWAGNALMLDIVISGEVTQLFAPRTLAPMRVFHIFMTWEGTGFAGETNLYLDGVLVDSATVTVTTLLDRDVGEWSDPSGATEVGNQSVLLNGLVNCNYSMWASWGNKTLPTATEIREELFEKGALPGITISSDTEVNMQTALDAISNTVRGDEPLNIRVEDVSGGGTLNLTADNITHNPLASIHVQFVGTGTLNWTNINGSNASIGSTTNGGTLNFINPAILTVSPLIADSEVRIYDAGTTTEIAGIESSGTSFSTSISVNSVDVVVHKETYEYIRIEGVDMTSGNVSLPIAQVFDRNYENP